MNVLSKFETFMQHMVEGSFSRIFKTRLQPVELAKKLERAMEENANLTTGRPLAPNIYDVHLSPKDYEEFRPYAKTLCQEMQTHLIDFARRSGYRLNSRPVVHLYHDDRLSTGDVHVEAFIMDRESMSGMDEQTIRETGSNAQSTQTLQAAQIAEQQQENPVETKVQPEIPQAWLTLRLPQGGGQIYRIENEITNMGRHLSNDIVVEDRRASRYHAQIRYQQGQFVIYDLGSTNGLGINNVGARQHILQSGDIITIGGSDFIFERK